MHRRCRSGHGSSWRRDGCCSRHSIRSRRSGPDGKSRCGCGSHRSSSHRCNGCRSSGGKRRWLRHSRRRQRGKSGRPRRPGRRDRLLSCRRRRNRRSHLPRRGGSRNGSRHLTGGSRRRHGGRHLAGCRRRHGRGHLAGGSRGRHLPRSHRCGDGRSHLARARGRSRGSRRSRGRRLRSLSHALQPESQPQNPRRDHVPVAHFRFRQRLPVQPRTQAGSQIPDPVSVRRRHNFKMSSAQTEAIRQPHITGRTCSKRNLPRRKIHGVATLGD